MSRRTRSRWVVGSGIGAVSSLLILAPGAAVAAERDASGAVWGPRFQKLARDAAFVVSESMRDVVIAGVAGAALMAIYYDSERPFPRTCRAVAVDKWQHCYVGCRIASWLPVGAFSATVLGVLKEVRDALSGGRSSWPDIVATWRGTWDSALGESCEAFCCERFGQSEDR